MTSSGTSLSILAVDDDPLMRKLLSDLLSFDGHHADVVESAAEAVQLLLRRRYSILINDHTMPGMTGLQLAREIRERGLGIPILLLSSDMGPILEIALRELGRAQCLAKPFLIDGLRAAIEHLVTAATPDKSETPRAGTNRVE